MTGIANSAIPFVLLPILTRVLLPSDYGKIVMFSSVLAILSAIAGLSAHGAVSIKYFDPNIDHPRYLATSIMVLLASTAIVFSMIVIFGEYLSYYIGIPREWLLVATLASAAQFVVQLRLLMWQVIHKAFKYGLFLILQTITNLTSSLFFILCLGYGWTGRSFGIVLSMLIFGLIAFISMQLSKMMHWKWSMNYAISMLKFGIPLIPHSVGGLLMSMSDRFAISGLLGIEEAGIYAAAMQVGMIVLIVSDACNKSFAPWLFKNLSNSNEKERYMIVKYTYILFLAIPTLAFLFGLIAPWILQFVVGGQYQKNSGAVLYIALGGGFGAMYYLVANYVFYAEKTAWLACVTMVCGAANAFFAIKLVQLNGAAGAAQAYMASQAMCFLLTWAIAARFVSMPWCILNFKKLI